MYDIIVAGGGLAGTFAAVAAARKGRAVLLLEQNGYLGGSLTACGVGPMMTAFAGERQVIGGMFQELTERLQRAGFSCGHVRDTTGYVSYVTPFSAEGMKLILDEMTRECGCSVLFHTQLAAVEMEETDAGKRIKQLGLCNKDGLTRAEAEIMIDATGDGDLAWMAGAPMQKGREPDGMSQPMTMNMKYSNVDREALLSYLLSHLEEFPRLRGQEGLLRISQHLSVAGFSSQLQAARERGEITFPREELLFFETDRPGEFIVNTTRITGMDGTDARSLSQGEQEGRRQCWELHRFLQKEVPGFESACLIQTGPSVGVRSSRQLRGCCRLEADDIRTGRMFPSRIALSAYPMDVHNPEGTGTDSQFVTGANGCYSIPYEVMYCSEIENLLVTGRCVSASFEAQAAIRTTPTTAAMGQAAGTAAHMAVEKGILPGELDRKALQRGLLEQGVILSAPG